MKKLIRFIIALAFVPVAVLSILLTAAITWLTDEDWDYLRRYWTGNILTRWLLWRDS